MNLQFGFLIIGLVLLYNGAKWLVDGATLLAKRLDLSPIIIGLTIVAFGTSAPELLVSTASMWREKDMMAIGNIIGSNICNFTMVLGITALIKPVTADKTVLKQDIPFMLLSSMCLLIMSLDSLIGRINGATLFSGALIYIFYKNFVAKRNTVIESQISKKLPHNSRDKKITEQIKIQLLIILTGILALITGAELLVKAAIKIMLNFGVSERFVGLTIVAIGTSIPELATSIIAIIKKQTEISLGNIVGSNIFNILSVIGITAMIKPISIRNGIGQSGLAVDYLTMLLTGSLPLLLMKNGQSITKTKGVTLLFLYSIYILFLFKKM